MKKLSFKGDPPPSLKSSKKKKSKRIREDVDEINNLPDDGWVVVKEIDDLSGPVIILFARGDKKFAALSSSAPSTISTAIKNTPFLSPIHADTNAENPLATVEPDSVRQVKIFPIS